MASRTIDEAKQRLKQALQNIDGVTQTQLAALERELLEAKATKLAHETELQELRQYYTREKSARETADALLTEIKPRLEEMSGEILNILKNAGAH